MQKSNVLFENLIELLKTVCPAQGVVLDVGCGCAFIRKEINALGLEYSGVFLSEADEVDFKRVEAQAQGRTVAAVTILRTMGSGAKADALLSSFRGFAARHSAPLILSAPNIACADTVYALLEGGNGRTGESGCARFFTDASLSAFMNARGFYEIARVDCAAGMQTAQTELCAMGEGSLLRRYLDTILSVANPHAKTETFLRAYLSGCMAERTPMPQQQRPFLSVVIRTQGRRPEALREALLCLSAQSNTDFEALVMGHRLGDTQNALVESIIEETPQWIREKIRLIRVEDAGRSAPLNAGFLQAKGRYISILDDDDLVFDDWVEHFYRLSIAHPGSVLHAYSLAQEWAAAGTQSGEQVLRACGAPGGEYCVDFDAVRQLYRNTCPTGGLAFPSYLHQKMGFRFDERLNTTEDWDYLMRASFICGVADVRAVTFLYRIWVEGENSKTMHDQIEWQRNYATVQDGFDRLPLLLPPGCVSKIVGLYKRHGRITARAAQDSAPALLYIGDEEGFSEEKTLQGALTQSQTGFSCSYEGLDAYSIAKLRWDPREDGGFIITDFKAAVSFSNGEEYSVTAANVTGNGHRIGERMVFLHSDPQIHIPLPDLADVRIVDLCITGRLCDNLFSHPMDAVLREAIKAEAQDGAPKRRSKKPLLPASE